MRRALEMNLCLKCGTKLEDKFIHDSKGNKFCSADCRRFFWQEIRKENDSLFYTLINCD